MKRLLKKAFTLVELLVVIAILAALAAISIISFTAYTKKANNASDNTLLSQLNHTLVLMEDEPETYYDMKEWLEDETGYPIDEISTFSKNCKYAWNITENKLVLVEEGKRIIQPSSDAKDLTLEDKVNLFVPVDSDSEFEGEDATYYGFSIYLKDEAETDGTCDIKAGFDAGTNTNILAVNYNNSSEDDNPQSVVIRTNSFETKVTINGKSGAYGLGDEVSHYGYAYLVDVQSIADASYKEYGTIGRLKIDQGHVIAKNGCEVFCLMEVGQENTQDTTVENGAKVHEQVINLRDIDGNVGNDCCVEKDSDGVANGYVKVCAEHDISNMAKIITDNQYAYYVCKTCGYTLKDDGTAAGTLDEEVKEAEHIGEIVQNNNSSNIQKCDHDFHYEIRDEETHVGTCSHCGVSFVGNHDSDGQNNCCSKCGYQAQDLQGSENNPFTISNGEEWTDAPNHANGTEKTYFTVTASFDLTDDQTLNVSDTATNMSINLNTYQVSGNGNYSLVYNYGTLELKNGGLDTLKQDGYTCVRNYGTMILNNVDIDSTWTGVYNLNKDSSTPAELSITECRIYGNNLAIYNGSYDDNDNTNGFGNVEIFSGEFKSCGFGSDDLGWDAISSCDGAGVVTIHSGTFIYGPRCGEYQIPVGMLASDSTFTNMYKQTNELNSSEEDFVSVVTQSNNVECSLQFDGEEENEYASLINAYVIYTKDGRDAILKLKNDFVTNQFDLLCMPDMIFDNELMGNLTFDLNGYTFEQTSHTLSNSGYTSTNGVELIIKDSSSNADGCYYTSNFNGIMSLTNGTATISSGTIKRDTTNAVKNTFYMGSNSTLYITGGTFTFVEKHATTNNKTLFKFGTNTTSKIVISGGTFDGVEFAATQDFIDNTLSKISKAVNTNYQLNYTIKGSTIEITQSKK